MSIKAKERWLIPFIILAVFPLIAWTEIGRAHV